MNSMESAYSNLSSPERSYGHLGWWKRANGGWDEFYLQGRLVYRADGDGVLNANGRRVAPAFCTILEWTAQHSRVYRLQIR